MLSATNLCCLRNEIQLFSNLSFSLEGGEILQVKGPNGSGKTSLLRLLCGLGAMESGEIRWQDQPVSATRFNYLREIIYIGHNQGVKNELTVTENLVFFDALSEQPSQRPIDEIIRLFELDSLDDCPLHKLSAGQKRRVALARLMLHKKKLWILDEPQTALDSKGLTLLEQLYQNHIKEQGMIIVATHHPIQLPATRIKTLTLGR